MITIDELRIYPIKSCRGIRIPDSTVEPEGLALDRRWMIVDNSGLFVSQRRVPRMACISVDLRRNGAGHIDGLTAGWQTAQGLTETLDIALDPPQARGAPVTVWDDGVEAMEYPDAVNEAFSRWLGIPCRLVKMARPESRLRHLKIPGRPHPVSFADGAPVLLASTATLAALARHHGKALSLLRFRPNIIVSGASAFAEESWRGIRCGSFTFDGVYPCRRCIMIEINPDAGVRDETVLRSLQNARTNDLAKGVYFGVNLVPSSPGTLSEGDGLEVY